MAKLFSPAFRDGRSAVSLIIPLVQAKPYGYVLTFEEIGNALGVSPDERTRIRSAMQRAKPHLEKDCLRAVETRPRIGYAILHPGQHARLAASHRQKSDSQIQRAISVIDGADERDMTDAERDRNRQTGMVLRHLHDRQRESDGRIARLESLLYGPPKALSGTTPLASGELLTVEGERAA